MSKAVPKRKQKPSNDSTKEAAWGERVRTEPRWSAALAVVPAILLYQETAYVMEQLLGGPLRERMKLARMANAITHVREDSPPFLTVHGDCDEYVHFRNSELLFHALKAVDSDVTFIPVPGGKHAFAETWDWSMEQLRLEFFSKHLLEP